MFSDKQLPYLPAGLVENKTQLKISHVPFSNTHIEELSCISKTEYCVCAGAWRLIWFNCFLPSEEIEISTFKK